MGRQGTSSAVVIVVTGLVAVSGCSLIDLGGLSAGGADEGVSSSATSGSGTTGGGASGGGGGAGQGGGGQGGSAGPCPTGRGPSMVHVPATDGAYCIDSTEVTVAQYLAFIDAAALDASLLANQGAECALNTSFAPPSDWVSIFADITQSSELDDPIRVVDHCDAKAFCRWSDKQLCGGRDGGKLGLAEVATTAGAWFHACSAGGTKVYPYGAQPEPPPAGWPNVSSGLCFDGQPAPPFGSYELWTEPVATNSGCEGGFPGIFDMSGNAYEWIDACDETTDPVRCVAIGGASHFQANATYCAFSQTFEADAPNHFIGFRCCATPD